MPQSTDQHPTYAQDPSRSLIAQLLDVVRQCEACGAACLHEPYTAPAPDNPTVRYGHQLARAVLLTRDCAEICALTARLLNHGSPLAKRMLAMAAEAAGECAQECAAHAHEHTRRTAELCFALRDTAAAAAAH